jgi:cytochrome c biogenesis protein CcmG, thiol:disulfide interchange protein DsbE
MAGSSTPTPIVRPATPARGRLIFGGLVTVMILAGIAGVIATKSKTSTPTSKLPAIQAVVATGAAVAQMPESGTDPAIGATVPTITGRSFDGTAVRIPTLGKRTMIVVVAHWCPHCQREVPLLVDWQKSGAIPADLDVVLLSTSVRAENGNYPPAVWLESIKNPFPVMADDKDSRAATALGNTGFPTLILVDEAGKVVRRMSGEHPIEEIEAFAKK